MNALERVKDAAEKYAQAPARAHAFTGGVYRITDIKSGRVYIGSSVNIENRWRQHRYRLVRGDHPNPTLQAIWNAENSRLEFSVIERTPGSKDAILSAEQRHLTAALESGHRACLNVLYVAGSHLGRKRSDSTREALAIAQRGKKATQEARSRMREAKLRDPFLLEKMSALGRLSRGRKINRARGGNNPKVRAFTDAQVKAMRTMKSEGQSYSKIESLFGVSHGGLQKIIYRETYRDVI